MEKSRDGHEVSGESTEGQPSLKPGLDSHGHRLRPTLPAQVRIEMRSDSEAIWPNRWPRENCRGAKMTTESRQKSGFHVAKLAGQRPGRGRRREPAGPDATTVCPVPGSEGILEANPSAVSFPQQSGTDSAEYQGLSARRVNSTGWQICCAVWHLGHVFLFRRAEDGEDERTSGFTWPGQGRFG